MKLLMLLAVVAFAITVAASNLQALADVMPPCALKCLVSSVQESGCPPTNETCICTNPVLTSTMEVCVSTTCTIKESLTTKNITSSLCHAPIRDRSTVGFVSGLVGGILALLAYVGRMASRLPYFGSQLGWDDFVMTLAVLLMIPLSALSVVLADLGLGRDMWKVPFQNITNILHVYYFSEILYIAILPLTKISILLFYLRIFPKKSFRIATYITIAYNVGYLITFSLLSTLQCMPIDGAWLRWDGTPGFKCNNENAQGWAAAIFNMVGDIVTLILPLSELWFLNLSLRKKISVMGMFLLGIFVTLVSILRLRSLIEFSNAQNITWDYVDVGYWSTIEVDVGIICACLPAIRSLLRSCFPVMFGDTRHEKSSRFSTSRSNGTGSRLDEVTWPKSGNEYDKLALVDMNNSSEVRLANGW